MSFLLKYKKGYKKPEKLKMTRKAKPSMKLLARAREILGETSHRKVNGRRVECTRFDKVAEAFVRAMEAGSYVHMKEYIDREEGKVPTRIADADGSNLKMYVNMPTDGDEAP